MKNQPVVSLISLGCPKNTVDSERVLGLLVKEGCLLAEQPEDADICIVNTCGFIQSAREEVAEVLQELEILKGTSGRPKILAMGCLVEHLEEQGSFLKHADMCVPFKDYLLLPTLCKQLYSASGESHNIREEKSGIENSAFSELPRVLTGDGLVAQLKISEGCSHACSFCAIPAIRGKQVSRRLESIEQEARDLMASGVREISIIAQDTSAYGLDLYGERSLAKLLRRLTALPGDCWFRLMYVYPANLTDDVLDIIANEPRFCPYVDIPLQHISDRILTSMKRTTSSTGIRKLLDQIRTKIPGVAIRTAFIVGYPGETEAEFKALCAFVEEQALDHMGVFTYSQESGTHAATLVDDVPSDIKQQRKDSLMLLQQAISEKKLISYIGDTIPVILEEEVDFDGEQCGIARSMRQAQEIDGVVIIKPYPPDKEIGDIFPVHITDSMEYDLIGKII